MKHKFVVSGSADTKTCCNDTMAKAEEVGREIARQGGILITGATTGAPYAAAKGATEEGGVSIGISPAASYSAHVKSYKLPTENFDFIIYSGFHYSGRNLILTKSADAVIIICGGFGTLNEFTIALEDNKPIGVLVGTCGATDQIAGLLEKINDPHRHGAGKIVYRADPKELVIELTKLIKTDQKNVTDTLPHELVSS
ncbi:MAG: LOG family protein [bacterium]|nr:LOG family protein [bacterium]